MKRRKYPDSSWSEVERLRWWAAWERRQGYVIAPTLIRVTADALARFQADCEHWAGILDDLADQYERDAVYTTDERTRS